MVLRRSPLWDGPCFDGRRDYKRKDKRRGLAGRAYGDRRFVGAHRNRGAGGEREQPGRIGFRLFVALSDASGQAGYRKACSLGWSDNSDRREDCSALRQVNSVVAE